MDPAIDFKFYLQILVIRLLKNAPLTFIIYNTDAAPTIKPPWLIDSGPNSRPSSHLSSRPPSPKNDSRCASRNSSRNASRKSSPKREWRRSPSPEEMVLDKIPGKRTFSWRIKNLLLSSVWKKIGRSNKTMSKYIFCVILNHQQYCISKWLAYGSLLSLCIRILFLICLSMYNLVKKYNHYQSFEPIRIFVPV